MAEQNKSIAWVITCLFLAVGYAGWAFLAADYFQNGPDDGPGRADFWGNSLAQIPNFARVISHAFQNRLWLLIVVCVAEAGVLGLGVAMKKVEKDFSRKR